MCQTAAIRESILNHIKTDDSAPMSLNVERGEGANRRGHPRKDPNDPPRKYATVSQQDRERLLDCHRRGGDLTSTAKMLAVNIKTARSIVRTDRDVPKRRGGSSKKFGPEVVNILTNLVDTRAAYTLKQLRQKLMERIPNIDISLATIDRLLDGHSYSLKKLTLRPADRNREDVKSARRNYAMWLQSEGPQTLRYYVDETNFNIWCSRSYGRSKKGTPAVKKTTNSKGSNVNIVACMSCNGVQLWRVVERVTHVTFNEFLEELSRSISESEPGQNAVIIMDNAPAHKRAQMALLCDGHTVKYLPPYSPFFNPIEEMFAKFKFDVRAFLTEREEEILAHPAGTTIRDHRRSFLLQAAQQCMERLHRVDCASFDRNHFRYVSEALERADM